MGKMGGRGIDFREGNIGFEADFGFDLMMESFAGWLVMRKLEI
jgi:hypothetical protein